MNVIGWFREAHGEFCHSNDNPLYGGGIRFPPPKESLDCLQKEVSLDHI